MKTRVSTRKYGATKNGSRRSCGSRNASRWRCCPRTCRRALRNADFAGRFEPANELGGDLHDFLAPEPNILVVAVGDVSGKGAPAALYGAYVAELVRSRTLRRRYTPDRFSVSGVLQTMNQILHERQLEEYYCTLCYAFFDFERRVLTMSNSGLPYPIRCSHDACAQIELPGVPLGSFPGVTYDEVVIPLERGDVFVFCSDGVFETVNAENADFGATARLRRDPRAPPGHGQGHCRCGIRGGQRLPGPRAAERRHDRGGCEGYGVGLAAHGLLEVLQE